MNNRKESEIIERISELTGKPKSTLYDWKKSEKNIKVYEVLKEYIELKEKYTDVNNHKTKKFYHLMMAELAEIGI